PAPPAASSRAGVLWIGPPPSCYTERSSRGNRAGWRRADMSHRREKVVLIDAYTLIHRAFYALPPLHPSGGEPTNAVLGFANMLLAHWDGVIPEYVASAFVRSCPSLREEMFDEYKAKRRSMQEERLPQIARAEQFLEAMNIPVFGRQG